MLNASEITMDPTLIVGSGPALVQRWAMEADGTRYEITAVFDAGDGYVLVMYEHGGGNGRWARLAAGGYLAVTYVEEKFGVRGIDADCLTRLIAAALGREQ